MPFIFLITLGSSLPSFPLPSSKSPAETCWVTTLCPALLLCGRYPWSLWALDHFCVPGHHGTFFTDKHLLGFELTVWLGKRGGVNILFSTKELSTNSETKGRNVQRLAPVLACCIWFPSCNSLNVCLSLQKSGAKAWLLSALLANEDRNLPLSPPGN